jgi:hypothetical protein
MNYFHIIQYNARKNKDTVMAAFLREREVQKADVIAIQEPWWNEYSDTTHQPITATHQLLFRRGYGTREAPVRTCLYISKNIDPATWSHRVINKDYQLLKLRRSNGEDWTDLFIHNVYRQSNDAVMLDALQAQLQCRRDAEHVIVGDLNLHHPAWGGPNAKRKALSERLLDILDDHALEVINEPGVVTWDRAKNSQRVEDDEDSGTDASGDEEDVYQGVEDDEDVPPLPVPQSHSPYSPSPHVPGHSLQQSTIDLTILSSTLPRSIAS